MPVQVGETQQHCLNSTPCLAPMVPALWPGELTVYLEKLKVHKDRARVGLQTPGNQDKGKTHLTLWTDQEWS